MLAVMAAPVCAAQPEWRSWGSGDAAASAAVPVRPVEAAAAVAVPAPSSAQTIMKEVMQGQQQLQLELRELRDLVERQGYEIEMLKKASKDSYADTDRRLRGLEKAALPVSEAPVAEAASAVQAPVPQAEPPVVASDQGQEQAAYDQAFALLKVGKYAQAIKAFDGFVQKYPVSPMVANAQYWSGEAHYVLGDIKGALSQFELVVKGAPAHPKVPDALLKIGYVFYDQKNHVKAKDILNKVMEQFPGSQAANLAEQRLKRMQQEGV